MHAACLSVITRDNTFKLGTAMHRPTSQRSISMGVNARVRRATERRGTGLCVSNNICPAHTLRHHICKRLPFLVCIGDYELNATLNRILT